MKMQIGGVELEGTPEEVALLIVLMRDTPERSQLQQIGNERPIERPVSAPKPRHM